MCLKSPSCWWEKQNSSGFPFLQCGLLSVTLFYVKEYMVPLIAVGWSGTLVLCTLFQPPLLMSFLDQYVGFPPQHLISKYIYLNLSEIYFSLQFQTKWINPTIKCVLWTFQSNVHWSLIVTCLSPKPGEFQPIFKSYTEPFNAASFEEACLCHRQSNY